MIRTRGLILAMMVAFASACATAGGGGAEQPANGNAPRDDSNTNMAGLALAQASTAEPAEAEGHYQTALTAALDGIEADSTNPKAYLIAGQAAVGLEDYAQADTMFERALELYPGYDERITSEREQGWVSAYNQGAEALNAGETDRALTLFEGADVLYQGRPEARMALGSLYLQTDQTEAAGEAYQGALEILSNPPPEGMAEEQVTRWQRDRRVAAFNAAQIHAQTGQFEEAAEIMQEYLNAYGEELDSNTRMQGETALASFMAQAGMDEEAEALYEDILSRDGLTSAEYFQAGIGFFNTGNYERAADAFATSAELNPYSRDALLNLVQSAYSLAIELEEQEQTAERDEQLLEIHSQILDAAEQVRSFDPLNRNVLSFMLRSLRAKADLTGGDEAEQLIAQAQQLFRTYEQQPYGVSEVAFRMAAEDQAQITGTLTNHSGTAGETVQLRFSVVSSDGTELDTAMVEVTAPEQGASATFSATVEVPGGQFAGWSYELID